jgi:hypothetical protein
MSELRQVRKGGIVLDINKEGFTFWDNGVIVFDCPLARAESDLDVALYALKAVHNLLTNATDIRTHKEDTE